MPSTNSKILFVKQPFHHRGNIPFFYNKTEVEFQEDSYERFDPMVIRQTGLHLADEIWGRYPWQEVHDFVRPYLNDLTTGNILELGCSTGRWIGSIAEKYPEAICWGIDYSYQLLKRAYEFWITGDTIYLDYSKHGGPKMIKLSGQQLTNLQFGLAKAEQLPFDDISQDFILNSFLLDRLEDPVKGMEEMYRVLSSGGKMVMVTPLNFLRSKHWEQFYPAIKIYHRLVDLGFAIIEWQEDMVIREPLDRIGNEIHWRCLAVVVEKVENRIK